MLKRKQIAECRQWLATQIAEYRAKVQGTYIGQRVSLREGHMLVTIRSRKTNKTLTCFSFEVTCNE